MHILQKCCLFLLLASPIAIAASPKSVIVNGARWTIVRQEEIVINEHRYDGHTSCDKHVIRIANDIGRCFEAVTLFHELEHASVCDQNFEGQEMSGHQAIDRLSFGMPKIIADNPDLRRYFGKASKCSWNDAE